MDGLSLHGAADVSGYIFMSRPRVGEIVQLPAKRIQVNLNTGQYYYVAYTLLGGSTANVSWNFNPIYGLPPKLLIIRSKDAFEFWRTSGGVRSDMKIHEQSGYNGEYRFVTRGDDNPDYYIIFLQTNVVSRTGGTADFRITSNTYALTDPEPVESCKIADDDCQFTFKALQEPYYLLTVAPPTGDSYTITVNYDQRKGAIVAVFVSLSVACLICISIIFVSWCGVPVLYLFFMSMVESVYRAWLTVTNCCRGIGRRLSASNSPVPHYYDDAYDPEVGLDAEQQPLLSPSAPLLDTTHSHNQNGPQQVVNGQPILPFNPSFYDLPRPDVAPPPYTPLDQHTDPHAPRHPSRGGPR